MNDSDQRAPGASEDSADPDPSSDSTPNLPVVYAPRRRRFVFDWLRRLFGMGGGEGVRASISDALEADPTHADDHLSAEERLMLRNVLELRELRADDVMVPRADIDFVDIDTKLDEVLRVFQEAGHSRLPVVRESLDDPVGFLHIKDVVAHVTKGANVKRRRRKANTAQPAPQGGLDLSRVDLGKTLAQTKLTREVLFVPPSMPAGDLLTKMQATRKHMAIVIDEYGGTDGLATIEDLVEEIVGDIEDEHDETDRPLIEPMSEGIYVADARLPLDDLQEALGNGFELPEDVVEDVDTLGGLVFSQLGRVPVRGELVGLVGGYEIEVIDADPRRIKRVRIRKRHARARAKTAKAAE